MSDAPPRSLPAPVITIALIALNVAAFALEIALGADPMQPKTLTLVDLGANYGSLTLRGEPWRLVSAMFLHAGVLHLLMNMYALWAGGQLAERLYGRAGFTALYLLAGLVGGFATLARHSDVPSVGASGAIFGVFGAIGAWLLAHRDRIDPEVLRAQARSLGVFIVLNLMIGASVPAIDNAAHVGGLLGGFVVGLALEWGRSRARSWARLALVVVVAGGAIAGAVSMLPRPRPFLRPPTEAGRQAYLALVALEDPTNALLAADTDAAPGSPAAVAFAERLEREVLPGWRAARDRLAALPPSPSQRRQRFDAAVLAYVTARHDELEAIASHHRGTGDAARVEATRAARKQAEQAIDAATR